VPCCGESRREDPGGMDGILTGREIFVSTCFGGEWGWGALGVARRGGGGGDSVGGNGEGLVGLTWGRSLRAGFAQQPGDGGGQVPDRGQGGC